jgi:tRNA (Thr-GGU) A37 N-methylase
MEMKFKAIGIIHSPYKTVENMPVQTSASKNVEAEIEIFDSHIKRASLTLTDFRYICYFFLKHGDRTETESNPHFLIQLREGYSLQDPLPGPILWGFLVAELVSVKGTGYNPWR